jgi:fatty acid desaturase
MVAYSLTVLLAAIFAALFLRLSGGSASWLPSAGVLLTVALVFRLSSIGADLGHQPLARGSRSISRRPAAPAGLS